MKNLLVKSLLLGGTLVLTSCNDVEGTLNVQRTFTARNGSKVIQVPTGTYPSKLSLGPDSARVSLRANSKIEFKVTNIPNLADLAPNQGVRFPGSQIGQNFDLGVTREVRSTGRSAEFARSVSCVLGTRSEPYQYCWDGHYLCRGTERNRECYFQPGDCRTEWRTVTEYGRRDVYGYNENVRERYLLRISDSRSNTTLATMNDGGLKTYTRFVETGSSRCR